MKKLTLTLSETLHEKFKSAAEEAYLPLATWVRQKAIEGLATTRQAKTKDPSLRLRTTDIGSPCPGSGLEVTIAPKITPPHGYCPFCKAPKTGKIMGSTIVLRDHLDGRVNDDWGPVETYGVEEPDKTVTEMREERKRVS